jgi:DNA-binding PadR family transcriptional regulator
MEIPLYILGLIRRFGPQHGYQIKKAISEEIADFAKIKLPTIYYHLQRMEADGLLTAEDEKDASRPERRVYRITSAGEAVFAEGIAGLLSIEYDPAFDGDALFYFADAVEVSDIMDSLEAHARAMKAAGRAIESHEAASLAAMSAEEGAWASIIFSRHRRHYGAEASWAHEALESLRARKAD